MNSKVTKNVCSIIVRSIYDYGVMYENGQVIRFMYASHVRHPRVLAAKLVNQSLFNTNANT